MGFLDIFRRDNDFIRIAKESSSNEEFLARAFELASSNEETLRKAQVLLNNANPSLEKAIPFEDFKHAEFEYEDYNDQLVINQLFDCDYRPSGLSNKTLGLMYFKSTLISSIVQTRVNQIQQFAKPQESKYELGFCIEPRDGSAPTLRQKEDIKRLTEAIENLGFGKYDPLRGDFYSLMRLLVQDSLVYDAMCFEKAYNRWGEPIAIKAMDASCLRPYWNDKKKQFEIQEYIDGSLYHTYDTRRVVYAPRNITTDRRWFGFGISELERLIHIVTSHLYAEEYNKRLFKSSHFLSGIISLKGQISRPQFQEFKRDFYSFVTGIENTNRVAIVNAPQGIETVNSIKSPQEMGFATFMDYLVKVAASVYLMDPVEINFFVNGGSGQSSPQLTSTSQDIRLKYSKDKGIPPLLNHLAHLINRTFLWEVTKEYTFSFKGLTDDSETQRLDRIIKSKKFKTLNEIRQEEGLPLLDEPFGSVIDDSGYMQLKMAAVQQEVQAQQMAQGMMGGMEGGPEGPEGGEQPQESFDEVKTWMENNDFSEEEIETVISALQSGSLTMDEFYEYSDTSEEEIYGNSEEQDSEEEKPEGEEENAETDEEEPIQETTEEELEPESQAEEGKPEESEQTTAEKDNQEEEKESEENEREEQNS